MGEAKYTACICEGAAEEAIIDILLEHDLLTFTRSEMLEEKVIRTRKADNFEKRYLRKDFSGKITVYRILDSRREEFKISRAYKEKLEVVNVVTAPEIEMLIILSEGQYEQYKKSGKKPSIFCKEDLRMPDVKSYKFVKEYFSEVSVLVSAIREYHRISRIPEGEQTLLDLLKAENY